MKQAVQDRDIIITTASGTNRGRCLRDNVKHKQYKTLDIVIDALGTNHGIIMFTIKTARTKK